MTEGQRRWLHSPFRGRACLLGRLLSSAVSGDKKAACLPCLFAVAVERVEREERRRRLSFSRAFRVGSPLPFPFSRLAPPCPRFTPSRSGENLDYFTLRSLLRTFASRLALRARSHTSTCACLLTMTKASGLEGERVNYIIAAGARYRGCNPHVYVVLPQALPLSQPRSRS